MHRIKGIRGDIFKKDVKTIPRAKAMVIITSVLFINT